MVDDNFFKEEDNGDNEIDYLNLATEIEKFNQANEQDSSSESKKTKKSKRKASKNEESVSDEIVSHVYLPKSLHYRIKVMAYFSHQTMSHFLYECILDGLEKFIQENKINLETYVKDEKKSK